MAVDTTHMEYDNTINKWCKLRDAAAGQEAVHAAKTKYLARLSGQSDDEYKAYVGRALFYGATARTIDGLSGMVFRKPPTVELPGSMSDFVDNITLDGLDLQGFAEQIVDDAVTVGRAGILVDHPDTMGTDLTQADAEALNIRPFLKHYKAESIFNWRMSGIRNSQVLIELRLWEWVEEAVANKEFEYVTIKQIRVLDLNDVGQYRQRIYRKNNKDEFVQHGDEVIPMMNNKPLDFIPFVFVGVKNSSPDVEKPPLLDLANVNFSHYKTTADLEHGAHFTGLPTAVISGVTINDDDDADEYVIGSATAWVFPNPETKAEYLEFQGTGLTTLSGMLIAKEQYMAFLGARMLTPDKKSVETAETAQIHRQGENSVLSSLSQSVSHSLEKALEIFAMWLGVEGDITYKLNKDFMAIIMSSQQLLALVATWQAGGIAFEDFLENLKRGEIVQEERTAEDIKDEVEQENPFEDEDLVTDG